MKRAILAAAVAAVLGISVASAPAQTDARESYDLGKKAFVAGQFDKSRELLLSASQLDAKSPEVHLWLGKACYELGLLDEALTAWNRTLELAPEEAYAKKMVAALRGQAVSPDVTLAVVDVMIRERQFDTALGACDKLLADKALTDAQRCAAMTRRAEALVGLDRHKDVAPTTAI